MIMFYIQLIYLFNSIHINIGPTEKTRVGAKKLKNIVTLKLQVIICMKKEKLKFFFFKYIIIILFKNV